LVGGGERETNNETAVYRALGAPEGLNSSNIAGRLEAR
jgi:hypothetical protein